MKKSFFSLILLAASTAAMGAIEVGKSYRIAPVADTTKSLMVSNSSTSAGAPVVVWTETNMPAMERWPFAMSIRACISMPPVLR